MFFVYGHFLFKLFPYSCELAYRIDKLYVYVILFQLNMGKVKLKNKVKQKFKVENFGLRVGKANTGKGLFAKTAIPKGACILEYVGKNLTKVEQETKTGRYLFETGKGLMIDGNIARFVNHSCAPNCEADGPEGRVFILTTKNIKAGEELTYDYGEEYFDEYFKQKGCRCKKCAVML